MDQSVNQPPQFSDEPLILGPEMLRKSPPDGKVAVVPATRAVDPVQLELPREADLRPGRICDNECILFDAQRQTSWIVYPPRSRYGFIPREVPHGATVEYHPWAPMTAPVYHAVTLAEGCAHHGIACGASVAIQAVLHLGWDPFR